MPTPPFWPADAGSAQGHIQPVQNIEAVGSIPSSATQAVYADPPAAAQASSPAADPRQAMIQQRLQATGALHYRLETAGSNGELFRFQCKMGLPNNPNYVSYFEATSSDATTAMQQVLDQVEAWRAGSPR
jgi:hypothetical protein